MLRLFVQQTHIIIKPRGRFSSMIILKNHRQQQNLQRCCYSTCAANNLKNHCLQVTSKNNKPHHHHNEIIHRWMSSSSSLSSSHGGDEDHDVVVRDEEDGQPKIVVDLEGTSSNNNDNDIYDNNTQRLSSSSSSSSSATNTKYSILKAFDTKITENIQQIISIVDNNNNDDNAVAVQKNAGEEINNNRQQQSRHTKRLQKKQSSTKPPLSTRWKIALSRETYHNRFQWRQQQRSSSTEDMWDKVIDDFDLPFVEDATTTTTATTNRSNIIHSTREQHLSPILGLDIDKFGHIIHNPNLVVQNDDHSDENNNQENDDDDDDTTTPLSPLRAAAEDPPSSSSGNDDDLDEIQEYINGQILKTKFDKTVQEAIAILSIGTPEEWKLIHSKFRAEDEEDKNDSDHISDVYELLDTIRHHGESLTTTEANLVLARLTTDRSSTSLDVVMKLCLDIYREMVALEKSGRYGCGPDDTTYRILLLALSGRLLAFREAVILSMQMLDEYESASSSSSLNNNSVVEISSAALLNAMQACYRGRDIAAAERIIDFTLIKCCDHSSGGGDSLRTFQAASGTFLLMLDMLKKKNGQSAALELFERASMSNALNSKGRDNFLVSLCHWPRRTQRGDSIDVLPLFLQILQLVENEHNAGCEPKPILRVWWNLIQKLAFAAETDETAWPHVSRAVRVMTQDAHPNELITQDLLRIGVKASGITSDGKLAASLIQKAVKGGFKKRQGQVSIPHQFFRHALEACFRSADSAGSKSILGSFKKVESSYPNGVQAEIKAFGIMCLTRAGEPDVAKELINEMVAKGLKPSESLFGSVLHSLAVSGRLDDAKDFFDSLEEEPGQYGGIVPGPSCYDALLLANVRSHKWDDAIEFHNIREKKGIPVTPQTIQGLVLAHHRRAGKDGVLTVLTLLDEFVGENTARIDDSTLRLLIKVLLPPEFAVQGDDNESFRRKVRKLADETSCSPELKDASIELIRSIHTAKRNDERLQRTTKSHRSAVDPTGQKGVEDSWRVVLVQFLRFVRCLPEHK